MTPPAPPLTNVQRELLDVFALEVSDRDLVELRRVLAQFFAARASDAMDALAAEWGLTADDFQRWAEGHDRADRP